MPAPINIQVDHQHTEFTPGDTISGKISWEATEGVNEVALRLFWFTTGRGTQEVSVTAELKWPAAQGQADFSLVLPHEPYSFSGTLIALKWALEAVFLPTEDSSEKYEFNLTPDGQPITLTSVETPVTGKKKKRFFSTSKH